MSNRTMVRVNRCLVVFETLGVMIMLRRGELLAAGLFALAAGVSIIAYVHAVRADRAEHWRERCDGAGI